MSKFIQMSIEGSDVLWDVAFIGNTQRTNNNELKRKKKKKEIKRSSRNGLQSAGSTYVMGSMRFTCSEGREKKGQITIVL